MHLKNGAAALTDKDTPITHSLGRGLRACPAPPAAGAGLKIWLPGGRALLLRVTPGASAYEVVRHAAAACGLAPFQLALFCGGRRLLGPAPLRQAGGVRGGGTLRVVQRLAGGGAGAGRMRDAPKTKQAARLAREQAAAETAQVAAGQAEGALLATERSATRAAARIVAFEASRLAVEQATAEQAEGARLAREQAAAKAAARVVAFKASLLAKEQALAAVTAEQAAGARLATEQPAAEAAAMVTAGEAGCLVAEQAAADEAAAA